MENQNKSEKERGKFVITHPTMGTIFAQDPVVLLLSVAERANRRFERDGSEFRWVRVDQD